MYIIKTLFVALGGCILGVSVVFAFIVTEKLYTLTFNKHLKNIRKTAILAVVIWTFYLGLSFTLAILPGSLLLYIVGLKFADIMIPLSIKNLLPLSGGIGMVLGIMIAKKRKWFERADRGQT